MSKFDTVYNRYREKQEEIRSEMYLIMASASEEEARDRFWSLLAEGFSEGNAAAEHMLGVMTPFRGDVIDKRYDGQSIFDKLAEYYESGDEEKAYTLIESEWHRCYCEAGYLAAKTSERPISKRWVDCDDSRTRLTHDTLGGITLGLQDEFITANGHGQFPGGFDDTRDNAGCRCILQYEYIDG